MPEPEPLSSLARTLVTNDRQVAAILRDAANHAGRILARMEGSTTTSAVMRQQQVLMAMHALQETQQEMWARIAQTTTGGITTAVQQAATYQLAQDMSLLRYMPPGIERLRLQASMEAQARQGIQSVLSRRAFHYELSVQVYQTQRLASGWIEKVIFRNLALGLGWRDIARDVRKAIRPDVPGGVSYAAKRLARTEINNAFHTTQQRTAQGNPFVKGMQWHLSHSHPKPDVCDGLAGRTYNPDDLPPRPHPQCLCYTTPITIGKDAFLRRLNAGEFDRLPGALSA